MRLNVAGLKVADIELGGFDAESDKRLAEYFVATSYTTNLASGKGTLFLGRKGSGKSALFTQMPRLLAVQATQLSLVSLTPDQYAWAALRTYTEQGLMPEQAHANAWRITLLVETAATLCSLERLWSDEATAAIRDLRKFLADNFGVVETSPTTKAAALVKSLNRLNLTAFGVGIGVDLGGTPGPTLTPDVSNKMLERLALPLREVGVVVALDRLDESWDGSPDSRSLIIGLLKAAKDLNDRLGLSIDGKGLRVLVFLRSDIYDSLEFDDKDKHRPTERQILWSSDELKEMLRRRLPDGTAVDELFETGEMRGSISPFNYIVKRTFLRPREILQFVDACLQAAGPAATEVTKDDIRTAETVYSGWKVDDLKQEFRKVYPYFDRLLECLRQEVHRYDSLEELVELLTRKAPDLVAAHGARSLLEILFEASVVGVRLGGSGSAKFKSEDPYLALPSSGAVYVHQGLYDGLNIKEARKAAEA